MMVYINLLTARWHNLVLNLIATAALSISYFYCQCLKKFSFWRISFLTSISMPFTKDKMITTWQQELMSVNRIWSEESLTVSVGVPQVDSSRTFTQKRIGCKIWKLLHGANYDEEEILSLPISEPIELTVSSWSEHGTERIHLSLVLSMSSLCYCILYWWFWTKFVIFLFWLNSKNVTKFQMFDQISTLRPNGWRKKFSSQERQFE